MVRYCLFLFGSYSQAQEDLVISKLFRNKQSGFYVDIGASDGIKYSNTHYFYLKGWRGINIEPDLDNFVRLKNIRKHDINIKFGISKNRSKKT